MVTVIGASLIFWYCDYASRWPSVYLTSRHNSMMFWVKVQKLEPITGIHTDCELSHKACIIQPSLSGVQLIPACSSAVVCVRALWECRCSPSDVYFIFKSASNAAFLDSGLWSLAEINSILPGRSRTIPENRKEKIQTQSRHAWYRKITQDRRPDSISIYQFNQLKYSSNPTSQKPADCDSLVLMLFRSAMLNAASHHKGSAQETW